MPTSQPLFWFMSAEAREAVRAVYSAPGQILLLEKLRDLIDPLDRLGTAGRRAVVADAVNWGFLVIGKTASGKWVACAPWVRIEEVVQAHPSVAVIGRAAEWPPVAPVLASSSRGSREKAPMVSPDIIEAVWSEFLRITGKKYKLTAQRRRACRELAARYSLEEIATAFRGLMASDWHRGDNEQGIEYLEPHLVARNFDRFFQMGGK